MSGNKLGNPSEFAKVSKWLAEAPEMLEAIEHNLKKYVDSPDWSEVTKRVTEIQSSKAARELFRASLLKGVTDGDKALRQRERILAEIISTEETYVNCLVEMMDNYAHPLFESRFTDPVLPMEKVYMIFSNLEDILLVNTGLLSQLKQRVEVEKSTRVGDIFLSASFALRIYSRYISDYDSARSTLAECEEMPRFQNFLEEHATAKGDLSSMLIRPVQRIPRYEMLLRELTKVNRKLQDEEEHSEELQNCVDAIKVVAEENNERIRSTESKALLYDLMRRFNPATLNGLILAGPRVPRGKDRIFVKEGVVQKVHGRGGVLAECKLILLSDMLLYCVDKAPGKPKKLELHQKIDMGDAATGFQDANEPKLPHAIAVLNSEKSMVFSCESAKEKQDWLEALAGAAKRARPGLLQRDDSSIAMAVWAQDTPACQISKVKFTTITRRHHCRVNGECVSADCSRARVNLKKQLGRDRFGLSERVCDWCCRDWTLVKEWPQVIRQRKELRGAIEEIKVGDSEKARELILKYTPRNSYGVLFGSWLWKKGGQGSLYSSSVSGRPGSSFTTIKSRTGGIFGRRNWRKRWCEIRRRVHEEPELLYFEEPGDSDDICKGRIPLLGAEVRVNDKNNLSFTIFVKARDYSMRMADAESLKDLTDQDRGAFQLFMSAVEYAATLSDDDGGNGGDSGLPVLDKMNFEGFISRTPSMRSPGFDTPAPSPGADAHKPFGEGAVTCRSEQQGFSTKAVSVP